jgi:hypothetical protein
MKEFRYISKEITLAAGETKGGFYNHEDAMGLMLTVFITGMSKANVQGASEIIMGGVNVLLTTYIQEVSGGCVFTFPNPICGGFTYKFKNVISNPVLVTIMGANS